MPLHVCFAPPRAFKNNCWQFRAADPKTASNESGVQCMGPEGRERQGREGVCARREMDEVCGGWGVREHRLTATTNTSCLYNFALRLLALAFKNPDTLSHESRARRMGREGREGHGREGLCAWRVVNEV